MAIAKSNNNQELIDLLHVNKWPKTEHHEWWNTISNTKFPEHPIRKSILVDSLYGLNLIVFLCLISKTLCKWSVNDLPLSQQGFSTEREGVGREGEKWMWYWREKSSIRAFKNRSTHHMSISAKVFSQTTQLNDICLENLMCITSIWVSMWDKILSCPLRKHPKVLWESISRCFLHLPLFI